MVNLIQIAKKFFVTVLGMFTFWTMADLLDARLEPHRDKLHKIEEDVEFIRQFLTHPPSGPPDGKVTPVQVAETLGKVTAAIQSISAFRDGIKAMDVSIKNFKP